MSLNTVEFRARPEEVFRVLVDAFAYGYWVVGARRVVAEDPAWPAPGTSFTHEQGAGPLHMRDTTSVLEIDSPHRLLLRARVRQVAFETDIEFFLTPIEHGTSLTMREDPVGTWGRLWNPAFDRLMWARNVVALERLQTLVEPLSTQTGAEAVPAPTEARGVPALVGAATALAFWGLGTIRGSKVFHPSGELHEATLELTPDPATGSGLLRDGGTHRAIVRLSRGIGLPSVLPDFPGLAIKLPDRWGPGADQDVLLVSAGAGRTTRRFLRPSSGDRATLYSSLTPYATPTAHIRLGAAPTAPDRFAICVARDDEEWRSIGSLRLHGPYEGEASFDVWNTRPDLVPTGVINALRKPAYAGSREGRG